MSFSTCWSTHSSIMRWQLSWLGSGLNDGSAEAGPLSGLCSLPDSPFLPSSYVALWKMRFTCGTCFWSWTNLRIKYEKQFQILNILCSMRSVSSAIEQYIKWSTYWSCIGYRSNFCVLLYNGLYLIFIWQLLFLLINLCNCPNNLQSLCTLSKWPWCGGCNKLISDSGNSLQQRGTM
jgi:hypothetical protein